MQQWRLFILPAGSQGPGVTRTPGKALATNATRHARICVFGSERGARCPGLASAREERARAVRAAKVLGLDVAGVGIIRSAHGPLVLEVNSSPGLKGIEGCTGKDVAGKIIEYIEKDIQKGPNAMKGRG